MKEYIELHEHPYSNAAHEFACSTLNYASNLFGMPIAIFIYPKDKMIWDITIDDILRIKRTIIECERIKRKQLWYDILNEG